MTDEIAPGYSSTVYRGMDLSTIKKNIENGTIKTNKAFQRDIMLMFQNAIMYNRSDHDVYRMACDMQTDVLKIFEVRKYVRKMIGGLKMVGTPRAILISRNCVNVLGVWISWWT